ncbi:hypothetical protein ACJMK2_036155, partial [Sinanodonta woodiana]
WSLSAAEKRETFLLLWDTNNEETKDMGNKGRGQRQRRRKTQLDREITQLGREITQLDREITQLDREIIQLPQQSITEVPASTPIKEQNCTGG